MMKEFYLKRKTQREALVAQLLELSGNLKYAGRLSLHEKVLEEVNSIIQRRMIWIDYKEEDQRTLIK